MAQPFVLLRESPLNGWSLVPERENSSHLLAPIWAAETGGVR